MSRYLDYCEPTDAAFEAHDRPESLGPCCLRRAGGKRSREYLRKDYKGSVGVWCGGRLVHTWPVQTMLTIFMPALAYYNYVLPIVLPPGRPIWRSSVLGFVQTVLGVVVVVSFVLAAFMNPGIVPRNVDVPRELEQDVDGRPQARFLLIRNITIKQKFCSTCKIFRPPRSKHCQYCDNCVLRFDHHCTWLGNCVGLHNYSAFVTLIYSATAFLALTISVVVTILNMDDAERTMSRVVDGKLGDKWSAFAGNASLGALLIYSMFLLVATTLLSIYHTVIVTQNLTTNEHVKSYYGENPFDFGTSANCRQIFCYPELVLAEGVDYIQPSKDPLSPWEESMSYDDA